MSNEPLKVFFVGGYSRSGSTLLDRLVGGLDGWCSVGEILFLWERGFAQNQLCGCGQPFRSCTFWSAVVAEAFGGFEGVDVDRMIAINRSVHRMRNIPELERPRPRSQAFARELAEYTATLHKLYRAIQQVSGCRVLIDSSKEPSHGFILDRMPEVDLRLVHLVRDSRAVAASWRKKVPRPEIHWEQAFLPQFPARKVGVEWLARNLAAARLRRRVRHGMFLRYEDFVADVTGSLERILSVAGEQADLGRITGEQVEFGVQHTVSGNPMRFATGPIRVVVDEAWRRSLPRRDRLTVLAYTWPMLLRYGYLTRGPRPAPRPAVPGEGLTAR